MHTCIENKRYNVDAYLDASDNVITDNDANKTNSKIGMTKTGNAKESRPR